MHYKMQVKQKTVEILEIESDLRVATPESPYSRAGRGGSGVATHGPWAAYRMGISAACCALPAGPGPYSCSLC